MTFDGIKICKEIRCTKRLKKVYQKGIYKFEAAVPYIIKTIDNNLYGENIMEIYFKENMLKGVKNIIKKNNYIKITGYIKRKIINNGNGSIPVILLESCYV